MTSRSGYTAGHFELQIDGHLSTAYLKSVDGGHVRASVIDESIGPTNSRIKHISTVDIEPFSIDFGIAGAARVLEWIQQSWDMEPSRRNGQISHANFNLKSTFEHEFYDALIAETTFPTLDGASREAAYMKVKFMPEKVVTTKKLGASIKSSLGSKQKMWMPSAFRFEIDGIDGMEYTNKIESFTIKQGIKKLYTGVDRFPQIEPTKIEFPNLSGTIGLDHADGLLEWSKQYLYTGSNESKGQMKSGAIYFLSPDRSRTIFSVKLFEIGLHNLSIVQSTANSDQIKRAKFELFVGSMKIDGPGSLGLE